MLHRKRTCVCTTILPLFKDNYPNCAPQGAPQGALVPWVPQDKHPLWRSRVESKKDMDGGRPLWLRCNPPPSAQKRAQGPPRGGGDPTCNTRASKRSARHTQWGVK